MAIAGKCRKGKDMEITEKQVYEAMGMTPPDEEPGTQQPAGANEDRKSVV